MTQQPAFATDPSPTSWTEADLAALPDDGHRYEIIDGSLIVNPPPAGRHQSVAANLLVLLHTSATPEWRVVHELGLRLPGANLIPDIVVLRASARLGVWHEARDVALVVEVASTSTEFIDRGSKAIAYAEAGIPSYWRVGRDGTLTVHHLVGDGYAVTAVVKPGDTWDAAVPFPVTIDPAALVD